MKTQTPNTRKKFRRFKLQLQQLKTLEAVTPNKRVGKYADLTKMFTQSAKQNRIKEVTNA